MRKNRYTILQVIENMKIGGAQRTARNLMRMPQANIKLATYSDLPNRQMENYDFVLLHMWCSVPNGSSMNWPKDKLPNHKKLIIFNHDWHGNLMGGDKYLAYSNFAKENMSADSEIEIVPGGINMALFSDIPERRFNSQIVIGRLSTLLSGKINTEIISYWANLPAERFLIGGGGPMLKDLKKYFRKDRRFEFCGAIFPSRIDRFLKEIDIFVYDTVWHVESFCYVIIEAMAAGCVVIVKNKGALRELIQHGYNGFLYETSDEVIGLCNELKKKPKLRREISNNSQQFSRNYSLEKMHLNMNNIFINLLSE